MILLSFVLVVVSATALGFGVFQTSDPLVWTSLVAGLGAVALIVGSVLRRRRELVPGAVTDTAGQASAGNLTVGSASAGVAPAPSPTPSRSATAASPPTTVPVSPPGSWAGAPSRTWPWATSPPDGSPDAGPRSGWTGSVPAVQSSPDQPSQPTASADQPAHRPEGDPWSASPAADRTSDPWSATPTADGSADPWSDNRPGDGPGERQPADQGQPTSYGDGAPGSVAEPGQAAEGAGADGEPGIERVTVRDALRVAQLPDAVVVVDGHPRYHLAGCPTLTGAATTPLAISVARRGGFTPCAVCGPDGTFLARLRPRTGGGPSAD